MNQAFPPHQIKEHLAAYHVGLSFDIESAMKVHEELTGRAKRTQYVTTSALSPTVSVGSLTQPTIYSPTPSTVTSTTQPLITTTEPFTFKDTMVSTDTTPPHSKRQQTQMKVQPQPKKRGDTPEGSPRSGPIETSDLPTLQAPRRTASSLSSEHQAKIDRHPDQMCMYVEKLPFPVINPTTLNAYSVTICASQRVGDTEFCQAHAGRIKKSNKGKKSGRGSQGRGGRGGRGESELRTTSSTDLLRYDPPSRSNTPSHGGQFDNIA